MELAEGAGELRRIIKNGKNLAKNCVVQVAFQPISRNDFWSENFDFTSETRSITSVFTYQLYRYIPRDLSEKKSDLYILTYYLVDKLVGFVA